VDLREMSCESWMELAKISSPIAGFDISGDAIRE
jgi:hypothetical protein